MEIMMKSEFFDGDSVHHTVLHYSMQLSVAYNTNQDRDTIGRLKFYLQIEKNTSIMSMVSTVHVHSNEERTSVQRKPTKTGVIVLCKIGLNCGNTTTLQIVHEMLWYANYMHMYECMNECMYVHNQCQGKLFIQHYMYHALWLVHTSVIVPLSGFHLFPQWDPRQRAVEFNGRLVPCGVTLLGRTVAVEQQQGRLKGSWMATSQLQLLGPEPGWAQATCRGRTIPLMELSQA